MISRAIGLGIMIIVLHLLAPAVLGAIEQTIVSLLGQVQDVRGTISSMSALLPVLPTR